MARETVIISASVDKALVERTRKLSVQTDRGNYSALVERALRYFENAQTKNKGAR